MLNVTGSIFNVFRLYVETTLLILNIERRPNFTGFSVNVRRTNIYMLSRDNCVVFDVYYTF